MSTEEVKVEQESFQMSSTIAKLADALSKAQGEMKNAELAAVNPFFAKDGKNGKYSDLASVWDACREPLSKHGLAVVQIPRAKNGKVAVATVLMHSSGEWIAGDLELTPSKSDAQGAGSAITYARRYSLGGFAGIAPKDDDDGNAASGKDKEEKASNRSRQSTTFAPPPPPELPKPNGEPQYITPDQLKRFHTIVGDAKWSETDAKALLKDFGVQSSKHILKADYDKICTIITNKDYAAYLDAKSNPPAA